MKNLKKISLVASLVGVIGLGSFAYASDFSTPADIASDLTGKTVESLKEERQSGKTYGEIAKEAGKQEEFKASMLENKKAILNERVSQGQITQQEADKILSEIQENMKNCDGTGSKGIGKKYGMGFGKGNGQGQGKGQCNGQGMKNGAVKGKM